MIKRITTSKLKGTVAISPSKSDSQRALLASALSERSSTLLNVGMSDDEHAMLRTIESLGCQVVKNGTVVHITPPSSFAQIEIINAGESGLGVRLLTCLAATFDYPIKIVGEGSLTKREMDFFDQEFPKMNVQFTSTNGKLPFIVQGPLKSGKYTVDGSQSSQYISGLLMAMSQVDGDTVLEVEKLKSGPYIDMTISTMHAFDVTVKRIKNSFAIRGNQTFNATEYSIDGDWSSASYWLVAAALGHSVTISGLSMQSLQADKVLLNALMQSGCRIIHSEEGVSVDGTSRRPMEYDATDCPDLFPAMATYAALTPGISRIKGINRLFNKESNRAEAIQVEFGKMGVVISFEGEEMVIHGQPVINGAEVDAHNDHRMAMCLAIAGTFAKGETIVSGAQNVSKSYPKFWEDLEGLM